MIKESAGDGNTLLLWPLREERITALLERLTVAIETTMSTVRAAPVVAVRSGTTTTEPEQTQIRGMVMGRCGPSLPIPFESTKAG